MNGSGKWGGNFELSPNNRSYNVETISCAKNRFYLNYSAPQIFDVIFSHEYFIFRRLKSIILTFGAGIGNGTGIASDFDSRVTKSGILNPDLKSLGRLGLGQISLGQSRDKNLWGSQIPSLGTSWDSSPMGFRSPKGLIGIFWDLGPMGF